MSQASQPEQTPPAGPEAQVQGLSAIAVRSLGAALAQRRMYPPEHPIFGSPKNKYTYDPDRAKALLKEAGYGPGKPVKAKIPARRLRSQYNDPPSRAMRPSKPLRSLSETTSAGFSWRAMN